MARSGGGGSGRSSGGSRSRGGFTSGGRSSISSSPSRSRSTGASSRSITSPSRSTPSRSAPSIPRIPSAPRRVTRPSSGRSFTDGMAMGAGMEIGRQLMGGRASRGVSRLSYRGYGGHGGHRRSSPLGSILTVIIFIIIVGSFVSSFSQAGGSNALPVSTIQREALPKGVANTDASVILHDGLDWIGNKSEVMKGVNDFYSATGVWPMIYITDSIGGETRSADYFRQNYNLVEDYLSEIFIEVENNSGNMLVFIFDDGEDWDIWLQTGNQSVTVMDTEASRIFVSYMDRYWYSDRDTEVMLRDVFRDSATRIMQVTRPWWHVPLTVTIIGTTILVAGFIGLKFYKRKKDAEAREMENTERILSTDLGDMEDDASRLADQYE